jgi:hypothetical protein
MILHQDGNYTQPCTATSGGNMVCILDADELDLYAQGTSLSYTVPAGMCPYVNVTPYFYYKLQPGKGPSEVTVTVDETTGAVTESDSGDGVPSTTTATTQKVTVATPYTSTPTCTADYTLAGGPNCCYGTYNLTVVEDGTSSSTSESWGGNPNNCLSGPAMDSQTLVAGAAGDLANGYPKSSLYTLDGGALNGKYVIKSPLSKTFVTNAYIANFWQSGTTGDYPLTSDGVGTASPNAMQGPLLPAGTSNPGCEAGQFCSGNPWYEFDCWDQAQDNIARIRVLIRSWTSNTQFESFVANQTNSPATGTYNLWGAEPGFPDQPLEDIETWVTPYSSTLGAGTSSCFNNGTALQKCGFGNLYPTE